MHRLQSTIVILLQKQVFRSPQYRNKTMADLVNISCQKLNEMNEIPRNTKFK